MKVEKIDFPKRKLARRKENLSCIGFTPRKLNPRRQKVMNGSGCHGGISRFKEKHARAQHAFVLIPKCNLGWPFQKWIKSYYPRMLLKPQILHLPENDATKHCTAELQSQCVGGELLAGWRQVWLNWFKTRDLLRISFQKYSTVSNWKPLETQTSSFLPPISENRRIPYTKINIVIMIQLQLLKRSHNNKKEDKKLGKKDGTNT